MSNAAWAAYLAQLREFHAVRAMADDRGQTAEGTLRQRETQLDAFAERIRQQEKAVVTLAYDLRRPVRFVQTDVTDPAPPLPWDESAADLEERLHTAERAVDDVRHYGHLPPLLPTWPTWARNAAIYFGCALPNVLINCGLWLFYVAGDDSTGAQFTAAAWGCCFWPIAAVAAGIIAIRIIGVPRLKSLPKNEFDQPTNTEVALNIPLGFAVAVGVSAVSVGLLWMISTALGL